MSRAALDWLLRLRLTGTKLGLGNSRRLASLLGNPHEELRLIHVAGTNGKGSTCAILESIYRRAGYRTGLFTSPHLVRFSERIQVDRQPIQDEELDALADLMRQAMEAARPVPAPTFFEAATVMALEHFRRRRCEVVLWETGLGGRLDATNIVTPRLSLITPIGLDHRQWLGSRLEDIAREKAGIVKPGVPCLFADTRPETARVIRSQSELMGSDCIPLSPDEALEAVRDMPLALDGEHQRLNAGLALKAVELMQETWPVPPQAALLGLSSVSWPGRLQRIPFGRGHILLDGAHNRDSLQALCRWLDERHPGEPMTVILGILGDKGFEEWLHPLLRRERRFLLAPVRSGRALPPSVLAGWIADQDPEVPVQCLGSLPEALAAARDGARLSLVCGSIYLVGEALSLLEARRPDPLPLNEWDGGDRDRALQAFSPASRP